MKQTLAALLALVAILGPLSGSANAQRNGHERRQAEQNRQKTKNDWRNLATLAAGASAFGFIKNDPTLGFAGAIGALYSANRYEQDRKSQNTTAKARASIFSKDHFYRNGNRYDRKTVVRKGQKYYRFVKR